MEFFLEPLANPAQCSAAQCIKHSANHNGERNNERQHQERIAAAARQDAIIDLKQIDGRSEKKEIIAAAVCENEAERPRAGPQGGFQRRLRGDIICRRSGGISIGGPPPEICSANLPGLVLRRFATNGEPAALTAGLLPHKGGSDMHEVIDMELFRMIEHVAQVRGFDAGLDFNLATFRRVVVCRAVASNAGPNVLTHVAERMFV